MMENIELSNFIKYFGILYEIFPKKGKNFMFIFTIAVSGALIKWKWPHKKRCSILYGISTAKL